MENLVLEAYNEFLLENGISNTDINLDVKLGREAGLDSMGIVNFIIILEEKMDVSLDNVLAQIRKSKDLKGIVQILKKLLFEEGK